MVKKLTKQEFVSIMKKVESSKRHRREIENQAQANLKYEEKSIPYYENRRNGTW